MDWKPGKWKLNLKEGKDKWLVVLAVGLIFLILAFPTGERSSRGILSGISGTRPESSGSGQSLSGEQKAGQGVGSGADGSLSMAWNQGTGTNSSQPVTWNQAAGGALGQQSGGSSGTWGGGQSGAGSSSNENGEEAVQTGASAAVTYEQQLEMRLKELLSHVEGVGEVEVMIVLKSSEEKVWRTDRNSSLSSTRETDSNGGTRDVRSQEISEDTILTGSNGGDGPLLEKELKPEIGGVVVSATGGGSPSIQAEISAAVEALFDVPSHKIKVLKRAE